MPRNRVSAVLGSSVPRPRPQPFPSRSRSTLRRRAVVGVLVLLSLVLITISFRAGSGGAVHRVEGAGATVLRPFEVAAERVARPFRDGYGYFASLVHVKRENSRLKQQVNDLRQKELLGQSALEQNRVLRSQLKFIDSPRFPVDYTPVNTRIISWASEFVQQVVIAAGSPRAESFVLMRALKTVVERNYPRLRITVHETGGTSESLARLEEREGG